MGDLVNGVLQGWQLFALGSAVFAALTAIFGKVGVTGISSNLATFLRTVVILLFTAALLSVRKEWAGAGGLSARNWLFLLLSGLCTGLSWLCYYRALQLGPASRVAPLDKLSVVLAMLLAVAFLGETLSWKVAFGGLLILAGTVLVALG